MSNRIQHAGFMAAALSLLVAGGQALATDDPKHADGQEAGDSHQPLGDTWITTKVKASLLADEDVAGLDIDVETVDGVVTLRGDVASKAQVEEAKRIAAEIEGVVEVDASGLGTDTDK